MYTICCTAVSKTATSFLIAVPVSGGCIAAVPVTGGYMKIAGLKGNSNSSTKWNVYFLFQVNLAFPFYFHVPQSGYMDQSWAEISIIKV